MTPRQAGTNPRQTGRNPRAQLTLVETPEEDPAGTPTAQTLLAELLEQCKAAGILLHRRTIGQLAKTAKELLEDGFDCETISDGLRLAVATNEPHRLAAICQSINLAQKGALMNRWDADRKLRDEAEVRRIEARYAT